MKFFDILKNPGKYSLYDVASEIVDVEGKLPEFKNKVAESEEAILQLRKIKLGGGQVDNKELEQANRDFEEATQNLKAIESALNDLRERLESAATLKLSENGKVLEANSAKLKEEECILNQRFLKTAASLKSLLVEIEGEAHLRAPHIFQLNLDFFKNYEIFKEELEKLLEKQPHPTLHEKKKILGRQESEFKHLSVESIIEKTFDEIRSTNKK